ncbi:MAG TPA: hypothetical protein VIL57_04140 [Bacteroidia bacterium]
MMNFEDKYKDFKKPVEVPANYAEQLQAKLDQKLKPKISIWKVSIASMSMAASLLIAVLLWNNNKQNNLVALNSQQDTVVTTTETPIDSLFIEDLWFASLETTTLPDAKALPLDQELFEEEFTEEFVYEYLAEEDFLDL